MVTAFGVCRFPPALLTGYCAKGSLDQIVRKKRLSVRRLLVCLMDAAAGVGHLHRHGVIHCDLAARNLLMDEQSVVKGVLCCVVLTIISKYISLLIIPSFVDSMRFRDGTRSNTIGNAII